MSERAVLAAAQRGGVASWAELREHATGHEIRRAVASGALSRKRRDVYLLPDCDESLRAAALLNGTVSHRSAALLHGWGLWTAPEVPEITVPRQRSLGTRRTRTRTFWRPPDPDARARITSPLRTVVDCARDHPLTESLAVADSALRAGAVTTEDLRSAIHDLPRTGRAAATLALSNARIEAANPFESALRALTIQAVGPIFEPQVRINVAGRVVRPDLVQESLRIVIEADSHEFHTSPAQITKDCWRYDELSLDGWLVLRFAWEQVLRMPKWVQDVVRRAVELRRNNLGNC